jgi:hypothetical protein
MKKNPQKSASKDKDMKTEVKRYRESNKKILNVCKRSSRRH